jgi:energy-coupling factor transport system permease protein
VAEAASLRSVRLGRYWRTDSILHLMDPRSKLVAGGLITAATVVASSPWLVLMLFAGIVSLYMVARLPRAAILAALRPVLPLLLVLGLFQVVLGGEPAGLGGAGIPLLSWGPIHVSLARLIGAGLSVARLVSLVLLAALLLATTTISALVTGLEMLLRPLNRLGLPGHQLAMVGSIALRFMPILAEGLEAVQRAQLARTLGADRLSRWQVARNARRTAALIVPLFADAFRRVDDLTTAMLARCYRGGRGRTYYRHARMGGTDWVALGLAAAVLAFALAF